MPSNGDKNETCQIKWNSVTCRGIQPRLSAVAHRASYIKFTVALWLKSTAFAQTNVVVATKMHLKAKEKIIIMIIKCITGSTH